MLVASISTFLSCLAVTKPEVSAKDILHRSPNNRDATGFCRESTNLVSALSHVTEKAFNGIGGANIAVHHLWKDIHDAPDLVF